MAMFVALVMMMMMMMRVPGGTRNMVPTTPDKCQVQREEGSPGEEHHVYIK